MNRRSFVLGAPLALAACGNGVSVWAPDDVVNSVVYQGTGSKSLTLMTMRNVGSNSGAHTSLLIDASQRVLFDPAGSFFSTVVPERNDVLFGISPQIETYYISYHARETYYVEAQKVTVSPQVAEAALRLALANGPVPKAGCAKATSGILRQLPGFESMGSTYFPVTLRNRFEKLPNVALTVYREDDADDNSTAAAQINAALTTGQ